MADGNGYSAGSSTKARKFGAEPDGVDSSQAPAAGYRKAPSAGPVHRQLGKLRHYEQRPVMNLNEHIAIDPEQWGGKPRIRGMRIRVKGIFEMLGSGMTDADTLPAAHQRQPYGSKAINRLPALTDLARAIRQYAFRPSLSKFRRKRRAQSAPRRERRNPACPPSSARGRSMPSPRSGKKSLRNTQFPACHSTRRMRAARS